MANGFVQAAVSGQARVMPPVGGWRRVVEAFHQEYETALRGLPERFLVLLIDLDGQGGRIAEVLSEVPQELRDRVFVIGPLREPEDLRRSMGQTLEKIGSLLAEDCRVGARTHWSHEHLLHNAQELERLCPRLEFLFASR